MNLNSFMNSILSSYSLNISDLPLCLNCDITKRNKIVFLNDIETNLVYNVITNTMLKNINDTFQIILTVNHAFIKDDILTTKHINRQIWNYNIDSLNWSCDKNKGSITDIGRFLNINDKYKDILKNILNYNKSEIKNSIYYSEPLVYYQNNIYIEPYPIIPYPSYQAPYQSYQSYPSYPYYPYYPYYPSPYQEPPLIIH
jgi:ABC-type microcin C transport system permease subunit YejE